MRFVLEILNIAIVKCLDKKKIVTRENPECLDIRILNKPSKSLDARFFESVFVIMINKNVPSETNMEKCVFKRKWLDDGLFYGSKR